LAAGITIYAPAIVMSVVLGWDLNTMIIGIGLLVIIYTVSGGTKAVSLTQKWQMAVIMGGMFFTFYSLVSYLSEDVSFTQALDIAAIHGKMEIVNFDFNVESRYTIWSGLTGGLFLALSYFGTDQSQVQRYISGSDLKQSRMGLMFNAVLKIPMQFFILLTGVLVFVFYQYNDRPVHFNPIVVNTISESSRSAEGDDLVAEFKRIQESKQELQTTFPLNDVQKQQLSAMEDAQVEVSEAYGALAVEIDPEVETKDADYVFLRFILDFLPHGAIGLLLAVIFSAAMSSTAGELNALASTTMNDFVKRLRKDKNERIGDVAVSKLLTVGWGVMAISFALYARLVDNLIEFVNILGSVFYGTILGIFIAAFYVKRVGRNSIFYAAIITQLSIFALKFTTEIGYLWFNFIGCVSVIIIALIFSQLNGESKSKTDLTI
jgi:SSS family solute:Na+ symporter